MHRYGYIRGGRSLSIAVHIMEIVAQSDEKDGNSDRSFYRPEKRRDHKIGHTSIRLVL